MKALMSAVLVTCSELMSMAIGAQEVPGPQVIIDCVAAGDAEPTTTNDCGGPANMRRVSVAMKVPDFRPELADDYWYTINRFTTHSSGVGSALPDREGLLMHEDWLPLNPDGTADKVHRYLTTVHKRTGEVRYTLDLVDAPLIGLVMSMNNVMSNAESRLLMAEVPKPLRAPWPRGPRPPWPSLHDQAAREVKVSLSREHLSGAEVIALLQDITACTFKPDENGFVLIDSCPSP